MDLKELYQAYKVKKLAFEAAKKEEEKYKKLLKDAMAEAGEKDYTDEDGYRFECYSSDRKSIDEERLLAELHERELTDCISKKRENNVSPTYSEWCSFNSYMGWLKHCDSYRLFQKYVQPNVEYMHNYYLKEVKGNAKICKSKEHR